MDENVDISQGTLDWLATELPLDDEELQAEEDTNKVPDQLDFDEYGVNSVSWKVFLQDFKSCLAIVLPRFM